MSTIEATTNAKEEVVLSAYPDAVPQTKGRWIVPVSDDLEQMLLLRGRITWLDKHGIKWKAKLYF